MTDILLKLFVKDSENISSPIVRASIGKLSGAVGIFCNLLLSAVKMAVGMICGSVAVIADAMNNLTDASSSLVTLWGFRMAQQPADKDHPYGHARYEYISGLAVSAIILIIGVELLKTSVGKIISPVAADYSAVAYAVLVGAVLLKLWLSLFFKKTSGLIGSTALSAASVDSRNDVVATSVVIVGGIVKHYFSLNIDGYIGAAVAIFIVYSGICVAKETVSPLLGKQVDVEMTKRISELVCSHEKILGIHDLLVHDYGPGRYFATVHAEMSANENPLVCHEIIDEIECLVHERTGVHLVIHFDPVETDDGERNTMQEVLGNIIRNIDPTFSLHDFRIVRGAESTKLVFDLGIPYSMQNRRSEIKGKIDEALKADGYEYMTVIRFDRI